MPKIKLRMYGLHIAYIEDNIINALHTYNIDINTLVKEQALNQFQIKIESANDLDTLKLKLKENYYENFADWIKERIRVSISEGGSV